MQSKQIQIKSNNREELIDITSRVEQAVAESGVANGIVTLFVTHTTAAVTINENADPSVKRDILYKLNKDIPQNDGYQHGEGNSDAHLKSSLFGPSLQLLIIDGHLLLGTWQGVYFFEFD
ncbi:MAG: secondary thiamine-phosphate synthase enzyme YjbQ [Candidatus Zixiibacteriota bacterium]